MSIANNGIDRITQLIGVEHCTEGIAGIAQRLEKEGLKRGLFSLIVQYGPPLKDLCTDQCRGAPSDIAAVLKLSVARRSMRGACDLGCFEHLMPLCVDSVSPVLLLR